MPDEARLERTDSGLKPASQGWFVVNVGETAWAVHDAFGSGCTFESREFPFRQLGINVNVVHPGQPLCLYHEEEAQEDFLILAGECVLLVNEQERPLRAWDFFHCPAGTPHALVAAGTEPCVALAFGARKSRDTVYLVDATAARHGASVERETTSSQEAYAGTPDPVDGPAPRLPRP